MAEQKAKVVHGPGPRGMGGPRPKVENPGKLLKRIMAEVFQHYLPHCILVLICIVVSALANVQASLFLQTLIDDYIIPMTQQQDTSFAPLDEPMVSCQLSMHMLAKTETMVMALDTSCGMLWLSIWRRVSTSLV